MPNAGMQTGADQMQFLQLLVRLIGARRCIEVGVFTGYSALGVALALPDDGKIIACDVSEEYTAVAKRYWERAGVSGKIDLYLAPATKTLDDLIRAGEEGRFDFAYIDADKTGYDAYYERCLRLLRANGIITIDNVLWSGEVAKPGATDEDTLSLRALNEKIGRDRRVDATLLPIGDGLMVVRKR
jgi:caffeoyl-CoA O-methyltransferase